MLQQIADALPRYTVYATLFRSGHEGVRNALDQGYSAFRCFLSETIAVFNSKRVVWKNAEAKFEQALENIRYSNQKIEREVEAAHFVETQRHHEEEAKARRGN